MMTIIRTNSDNSDFQELVKQLDLDLKIRDGDLHSFYAPLNKTDKIRNVIVAYDNDTPVGCGAFREYTEDTMEIKRMFVPLNSRRLGIERPHLRQSGLLHHRDFRQRRARPISQRAFARHRER